MSVATEIERIQNAKANLKTSINAKNDSEHQITTETIEDYADFVDSIPTGGGSATQSKSITITSNTITTIQPDVGYDAMTRVDVTTAVPIPGVSVAEKDVNFYDYDGIRLYAYTKNEFLALESLPVNPTHTGLTAQGWNWTLADAKTYVTNNGELDIGQSYITDNGRTRLYIELQEGRTNPYLIIGFSGNGSAKIYWGDNTNDTVSANNTTVATQHIYSLAGEYVIEIEALNNSTLVFSSTSTIYSKILSASASPSTINNHIYQNAIKKVEIGSNLKLADGIGTYAFSNCYNLKTITLPNYLTGISTNAFQNCYSLKIAIIPNGITSLSGANFSNCYSLERVVFSNTITGMGTNFASSTYNLKKVTFPSSINTITQSFCNEALTLEKFIIPSNVTVINQSAFASTYSLTELIFPTGLSTINRYAFQYCIGMKKYDFSKCTSVPTLLNDVFSGIPSDCKIVVPDALYETWITASRWSDYANYIVKVSEA